MKKNLFLALVAIFVFIIAGCGGRDSVVQSSPAKTVSPKREATKPLPEEPKPAPLAAVQKTAGELKAVLDALNALNDSLLDDCSPLLPRIQVDKATGEEKLWGGFDSVVPSTETPVAELRSMVCFQYAIANEKGAFQDRLKLFSLEVSEEFTLLKRKAHILGRFRPIGDMLVAKMTLLEAGVEKANALFGKLYREIQEAKKKVPSNSPVGRLASHTGSAGFINNLVTADEISFSRLDLLEKMVSAFNAKVLLSGPVKKLHLTTDGLALLDPKRAITPSKDPEPKMKTETPPSPKDQSPKRKTGKKDRVLAEH